LVLFHEYFNGDTGQGLGASHQTGWTALVARLLDDSSPKADEQEVAVVNDKPLPLATYVTTTPPRKNKLDKGRKGRSS
jgi:hypothetical protein